MDDEMTKACAKINDERNECGCFNSAYIRAKSKSKQNKKSL